MKSTKYDIYDLPIYTKEDVERFCSFLLSGETKRQAYILSFKRKDGENIDKLAEDLYNMSITQDYLTTAHKILNENIVKAHTMSFEMYIEELITVKDLALNRKDKNGNPMPDLKNAIVALKAAGDALGFNNRKVTHDHNLNYKDLINETKEQVKHIELDATIVYDDDNDEINSLPIVFE